MKAEPLPGGPRFVCPACWHLFADGGARACPDCAGAPPREGFPSLPCGFRGRYTLTARIGRDAASALFHARSGGDGEANPRVLLEVARADGPLAPAAARKLFRREATLAGLLGEESDAFLGLSSIDVTEPAYIAFEHVPWPALADVLAEAGTLAPAASARVGAAILRAVAALERHELVHRALVPARIFVHLRHDGGYDVKIAGLGAWPDGEDGAAVAPSAEILAYASPEQLRGDPLTAASDVHMVASILWELVTGEVPYPLLDGAPQGEAAAHRLRRLARVPARPAAMPVELHELLVAALHPDPAERFHDGSPVAGLGMALERFAEELPRRQERALGATARSLDALTARLAPFVGILDRKAEIEATVRRLALESGGPGALRAAEEALADLEAEVEQLLAPGAATAASDPASIPPEGPPPPSRPAAFPLPSRRPLQDVAIPKAPALPSDATALLGASVPPEGLERFDIPGVGGSRWPYVVGVIAVVALLAGGAALLTGSKGTPAPSGSASAPLPASAPPAFQAAPPPPSPPASAAPSASAPPDAGAAPSASAVPSARRPIQARPQRARPPDEEPAAERPPDPE